MAPLSGSMANTPSVLPPTMVQLCRLPRVSTSLADALPRLVPLAAFSATFSDWAGAITGALSLASVTLIVNARVVELLSLLVARTVTLWLVSVSKSRAPTNVITPLFRSIVKRPPASSSSVYVTESIRSGSSAKAVMPTAAPGNALSEIASAAVSESLTGPILASPTSVTVTLISCESLPPWPSLAVTSTS